MTDQKFIDFKCTADKTRFWNYTGEFFSPFTMETSRWSGWAKRETSPFDSQTDAIVMAGEVTSKFVARQADYVSFLVKFDSFNVRVDRTRHEWGARNSAWLGNQCLPDGEIKLKLVSISLSAFVAVSDPFTPVSPFSMLARNRFGQFSRKNYSLVRWNLFNSPI